MMWLPQVRGMMNQGYGMLPGPASYMDPHAQGYNPYDPTAHYYANGSPFQEQPDPYNFYSPTRQFLPNVSIF